MTTLNEGTHKEKRLVPVLCATRDFQGAVAETIVTIWNVLWQLNMEPMYVQMQSHGYAFVRANLFHDLKLSLNTNQIRGFMIDDDILLKSGAQKALSAAIQTADAYGWNFVAPYRTRDGYVAILDENHQMMTPSQIAKMQPFDRICNAGLGFYYGDLPLDYQFHEGGTFGGEDLNFFWENPQLQPRIFDLGLKHLKVCDLDLTTPLNILPRVQAGAHLKRKPKGVKKGEKLRIKE